MEEIGNLSILLHEGEGYSIFPRAAFPSGNFPNVQFIKGYALMLGPPKYHWLQWSSAAAKMG